MNLDEYIEISESAKVPAKVMERYNKTIADIKTDSVGKKKKNNVFSFKNMNMLGKVATIIIAALAISGMATVSVKAYQSHLEHLKNLSSVEVIDLYENVFANSKGLLSRPLTDAEDVRLGELYDLFCAGLKDNETSVNVIDSKEDYSGKGLSFSKADGILYIPDAELSDEELLEYTEWCLLSQHVDYVAYIKSTNLEYYLNRFDEMSDAQTEEVFLTYYGANTETGYFSREFSFDELGKKKILKKLFIIGEMVPSNSMLVIDSPEDAPSDKVSFCKNNCTFYLPSELTDEDYLELIDFQLRVSYAEDRLWADVEEGRREAMPEIEYVPRDRVYTLDDSMPVDEGALNSEWLEAYAKLLEGEFAYFDAIGRTWGNTEQYYANVSFIYLNDDDIPELLYKSGYTDLDYAGTVANRVYLYTVKDGKAVLLSSGEECADNSYCNEKAFTYVPRKGMIYNDFYYKYSLGSYDSATGIVDSVHEVITRIDTWNFDTLTCERGLANMSLLHAVYNYETEAYDEAEFSYEYYVNVHDFDVTEDEERDASFVGDKVDRSKYEASEAMLLASGDFVTVEPADIDKIYCDDDLREALARAFAKEMK